jgi:hypothetical protein
MEKSRRRLVADHTAWCSKDILAGVVLAKILNDLGESHLIAKVNTILSRYDRRLKELSTITNKTNVHMEYFINLVVRDMKDSVLLNKFPLAVETHLLNLMTAKYRKALGW